MNFNVSWEENGGFEFLLNDDKKSAKCVSLWLRGWLDDDKKDKTNKNTNLNDETDESQEPLPPRSLWLNQRVISMWPDWGAAFLWNESGGCIDSYIEGYEYLADSWLKDEGYEWACKYMGHESTGFDWQGFNDKGRELWRTLQEKIASKYIVLYGHGWGESEGSFGERDELNGRKKREFELKIKAKNGGTGILNIKDGENYGKSVSYEALNLPRALKKGFEKWQKDHEQSGEKWQNALKFCANEAEKSSLFYYGDEFVSHKKVVDLKDLNGENLGLGEVLKDGENELILDEILSEKSCVKSDKSNAKDGESRRFVCNENGEFMDYDEFIALMNEKKAFDTQGLVLAAKLKDFLKDKAYIEFAEWVMHEKG